MRYSRRRSFKGRGRNKFGARRKHRGMRVRGVKIGYRM